MTTASDQVARLLALVPFLQHNTELSLSEVATAFGVTPAQLRKDLGVLWMCGLPGLTPDRMIDVDMEALEDEPDGLVRIDNADYLARPVRLGSSEAAALTVALRALREGSPESTRGVVDRVLVKLEEAAGSAPPAVAVHLPDGGAQARHAEQLAEAITADRRVRLDYYVPVRDETTRREVDPIAVLTQDGREYLDAWCHVAQARRLFRLDRIEGVRQLEDARSSEDLEPRDLADGLFEPAPEDPLVTLELAPHARWVAEYYPVEALRELGEDRCEIDLRVADPRLVVRLALRLAPAVRVLGPAPVRDEVREAARRALAFYG